MEGKRVGRERTRGYGTVGRGRKRAESRACECNYFRVELARGTGCYGQEWSKRRDAGGTKREENGTGTKEFEKVLQDGQENNWRVDVAHLSDEKIRSSRRQIPRRFRTQYSANHKIVADLTCRRLERSFLLANIIGHATSDSATSHFRLLLRGHDRR